MQTEISEFKKTQSLIKNTGTFCPTNNFDSRRIHNYSKGELKYFIGQQSKKIEKLEMENLVLKAKLDKKEIEDINKTVNQPTSKMPEYEKTKNTKTKQKRKKKRRKRTGSGNRIKSEPDHTNINPLNLCPTCALSLANQSAVETTSRIVEDIPPAPNQTVIIEEVCEKKWCPGCKKIVCSTAESALPKSDIGLNALVLIAYFWVVPAMSLPAIQKYLMQFFSFTISTSGLSKMMIRLADIMLPVYNEILENVKGGIMIFADETGWSVKGSLHWMWAFANDQAAYYWIDRGRGSIVVQKILGDIFFGVLITDAWCAYHKISCQKQTCMAHLFRKIRKFYEAYPQLRSLLKFKLKLRRIIMDGEKLQILKLTIAPKDFQRKLLLLKNRLNILLLWPNPNPILLEIIEKVARQKEHILTFVEHDGVPTTNNYGEYTIKKGILKRKISGGSMSLRGAKAYCVLVSIAQTCHLRKLSFVGFLNQSTVHYIKTGKAMLLSEYESNLTKTLH